jgi:hypothetical protein
MKVVAQRGVCIGPSQHLLAGDEADVDKATAQFLVSIGAVREVPEGAPAAASAAKAGRKAKAAAPAAAPAPTPDPVAPPAPNPDGAESGAESLKE